MDLKPFEKRWATAIGKINFRDGMSFSFIDTARSTWTFCASTCFQARLYAAREARPGTFPFLSLSCSLSLLLLSSLLTKLAPSSLSGPSFLFILTTFSLVMSSGSYTIWIVRKLQMFFVSIPMSIALQVWFSFLFLFLFSNWMWYALERWPWK